MVYGRCEWPNGNVYTGTWCGGIQQGRGVLTCSDGRRSLPPSSCVCVSTCVCLSVGACALGGGGVHLFENVTFTRTHKCANTIPTSRPHARTHAGMRASGCRESSTGEATLPQATRAAPMMACGMKSLPPLLSLPLALPTRPSLPLPHSVCVERGWCRVHGGKMDGVCWRCDAHACASALKNARAWLHACTDA